MVAWAERKIEGNLLKTQEFPLSGDQKVMAVFSGVVSCEYVKVFRLKRVHLNDKASTQMRTLSWNVAEADKQSDRMAVKK